MENNPRDAIYFRYYDSVSIIYISLIYLLALYCA